MLNHPCLKALRLCMIAHCSFLPLLRKMILQYLLNQILQELLIAELRKLGALERLLRFRDQSVR